MKVVLWESYADKLLEHMPDEGLPEAGIIVVLQFVIVVKFQSISTTLTHVIISNCRLLLFKIFKLEIISRYSYKAYYIIIV